MKCAAVHVLRKGIRYLQTMFWFPPACIECEESADRWNKTIPWKSDLRNTFFVGLLGIFHVLSIIIRNISELFATFAVHGIFEALKHENRFTFWTNLLEKIDVDQEKNVQGDQRLIQTRT